LPIVIDATAMIASNRGQSAVDAGSAAAASRWVATRPPILGDCGDERRDWGPSATSGTYKWPGMAPADSPITLIPSGTPNHEARVRVVL